MQTIDQAIRERAYHLWFADGQRDGHADAYWLLAQREILSNSMPGVGVAFAAGARGIEGEAQEKGKKYPAKRGKTTAAPKKNKRRAA